MNLTFRPISGGTLSRYLRCIGFFCVLAITLYASPSKAQVPVIFRVSEGVRPNAVVSLYGEYLTAAPKVRFLRPDGSVAATQPAVQTDPDGHFCRVLFPAMAPGAYQLSVQNAAGWSTQKRFVNRAEPRWISEERAYPGLPLKLIGRSLDAWEYNGARNTQVRLVPVQAGSPTLVAPDAVNPYCVDFSVPRGLAAGNYFVEVTANSAAYGGDWVRLDNHSEFPDTIRDTVLRVEPAPSHPTALALKIAWASDFNWNSVVDAKREFGAAGDGLADDTPSIQKALDQVSQAGGGLVFLPKGFYRVSRLVLNNRCILEGESRDGTVMMVSKSGDDGAIVARGSTHGITTMTLKYQADVPPASQGMLLGGTASNLFLHNTKFDLLRNPDVAVKQAPYYVSGSGPMLVADCQFFISSRNLWNHQVKNRVTFRDNFIDMHDGLGLCMSSEKLLVLHNELVFHPAAYAGQMNGFFLNEGWVGWNIYNAYVADNVAHDLEGPGDCQPYAADSAWSCLAGPVVGSSADTVEVRNEVSGDFKGLETHEMELIVVQGKGLGQLRRVSAKRNLGGTPAVVRFTVSPPWDTPPDRTSVVSAGSWHVSNVFYRNTARGSKSPYNMYYGGCYDCVDAEAVSENTEGWNNWGRIGEFPNGQAWHCPVYFNQLKRSTFTGLASKYATMGLTLRVENETVNYRGVGDYGTEIRDNVVDRAACSNKNQRLAGNAAIATFNQNWIKTTNPAPLILATLCEGNQIRNSAVGFDLNKSYAFAIRGTIYENCPQPVNNHGFDTALLAGAQDALRPLERGQPTAARTLTPVDPKRAPDLFVWTDTCNVYVLRDGETALLIDLGDGSVLDHLADIGVKRVEWVLFTHHHREQCQGAPRLQGRGAQFAAPEAERRLFEKPTDFRKMRVSLGDKFTIHGSSYVRPPLQPIPLDRTFKTNDTFTWHGRDFLCLDTRGNSPGGMSYLLKQDGRWLAFSGDLMLAGAQMHTWFDTEWDYGFAAGLQALRRSVTSLAGYPLQQLLPSHGPVVSDPQKQLAAFEKKLASLEPLYLRGYGVEGASVAYQDKVSQPTVISNLWQVSPHLFKFKRPNFWPNFGLILAESGHALVVDCGLLDEKLLDSALAELREHYGLKAIDAVIITHMHGDHFLEAPHLRQQWGAPIWALDNMVDKMEHPERFDYAAPIQAYGKKTPSGSRVEGVRVDRAFKPGETFSWEGSQFTVDWMPGQTEFALCLHGQIDGRKVAFTGDNIFGDPDDPTQTGHEAMVAHNSAILEEGYIYGAEFLHRLKPDLLVGGHSFVMDRPGAFIERYRQWAYQMRDAFQALSPDEDYRYWFDPFWVRAEPYRVVLRAGQTARVSLQVRNFRPHPQAHRIEIHPPPGLVAEPSVLEGTLSAESRRSFPIVIKAAAEATPGVRIVALDVTLDGRRYGEWFDFVVGLGSEPF